MRKIEVPLCDRKKQVLSRLQTKNVFRRMGIKVEGCRFVHPRASADIIYQKRIQYWAGGTDWRFSLSERVISRHISWIKGPIHVALQGLIFYYVFRAKKPRKIISKTLRDLHGNKAYQRFLFSIYVILRVDTATLFLFFSKINFYLLISKTR